MSGSPLSAFALDPEPKKTYTNMTTLLGCDQPASIEIVKCLQTLSIQTIIYSDSKFKVYKSYINNKYLRLFCINFLEYKIVRRRIPNWIR